MLNNYWGRNSIHLHSDYVGAVVLILAVAAFIGLRADPRRKQILFWSAALLVSLLWSLGSATPFYHIPYAIVPGTKYFLASTGALTSFAESFVDDRQLDAVRANSSALIAGAWRSFAFIALAVALGLATLRGRISTRAAAWGLAALMTIDLWTIERLYWMFSPPAKVIYASDSIVEMLKAEPQPVRVLALPLEQLVQPDPFIGG